MREWAHPALVCLAGLLLASPARAQFLLGLGDLDGGPFESVANAVSDDGSVVVGESVGSVNEYEIGRSAVRWTTAGGAVTAMTSLGWLSPGARESHAYAVSSDGSIVAGTSTDAVHDYLAFRWTQADGMIRVEDLALGSTRSGGYGVSDAGRVVGDGYDASGAEACFADDDAFEALHDPFAAAIPGSANAITPNGAWIVGVWPTQSGPEAFLWTATDLIKGEGQVAGLGDLAGGIFSSTARGISNDGSTVVGESESAAGREAFRWTEAGGMQSLGDLAGGSVFAIASGVSADGSLVVGRGSTGAGSIAFVWDVAHGMRDLGSVLAERGIDTTGWTLRIASDVSPDGRFIVGAGSSPNGNEAFLVDLPEPRQALLAATAAAVLAWLARRRAAR